MIAYVRALLLVALALAGCASPPVQVYAEPGLASAAAEAVWAWRAELEPACGIRPTVTTYREEATTAVGWAAFEGPTRGDGHRQGWRVAHTPWGDIEGTVRVDTDAPPWALSLIVSHELGHAFGADHSEDTRDLMYPTHPEMRDPGAELNIAPTAADVRQVCAWWGMP